MSGCRVGLLLLRQRNKGLFVSGLQMDQPDGSNPVRACHPRETAKPCLCRSVYSLHAAAVAGYASSQDIPVLLFSMHAFFSFLLLFQAQTHVQKLAPTGPARGCICAEQDIKQSFWPSIALPLSSCSSRPSLRWSEFGCR